MIWYISQYITRLKAIPIQKKNFYIYWSIFDIIVNMY